MFENDDERRDGPEHDSPSTEGGVRRRDVVKAAGGAILADASLSTAGATDDCTYEDTTYAVETEYANCKSIPVCVSDVDPECPVTAELHVSGEDCSETTFTREFSAIGRHTFELSGCCTPQKLAFTDGQKPLATVDIPFTNCGYDDLSVGNVQFCCRTASFDLSGVECEVVATLVLARDDRRKQITEGITNDGPVKFEWSGCFTPQSLTLERKDGETIAELSPKDALTCRCSDDAQTACTFDGGKLPSKGETKQFECQGVTFDVTTTEAADGRPACFEIGNLSDPIFRVDVVGDGTTVYSFTDCGTEWTGELCANAASADEPTAIESWAVVVCTEEVGGCVGGSVTTVGDEEVEWQTGDVASSCADVGGDTGDGDDGNGGNDDGGGGGGEGNGGNGGGGGNGGNGDGGGKGNGGGGDGGDDGDGGGDGGDNGGDGGDGNSGSGGDDDDGDDGGGG